MTPLLPHSLVAVIASVLTLACRGHSSSGPDTDPVLLTVRTPWGVRLTLNRPAKLNALSAELVGALTEAIDAAVADADVRVIAIEGAGRAFSSGYDLTEEAEGGIGGPVQWRELLAADVAATSRPRTSRQPQALSGCCSDRS